MFPLPKDLKEKEEKTKRLIERAKAARLKYDGNAKDRGTGTGTASGGGDEATANAVKSD